MGAAYTPGLKVSPRAVIRKERRLPLTGEVRVGVGDTVGSRDVVARTDLPGKVYSLNAAGQLSILEADLPAAMVRAEGDVVEEGELLAETPGFFGMFKARLLAPVAGTVENVSGATGRVMLREAPIPVEVRAYIDGTVVEIHEGEGCTVETVGAICQGIFGLGRETEGEIVVVAPPDAVLTEATFDEDLSGKVAVGGRIMSLRAYDAARRSGAVAVVCGGLGYRDIARIVGHEIGVAITGTEPLETTIVVTEGFGSVDIARRTYELLASHEGRKASVNGATQIRAGVIRPEVIVAASVDTHDEAPGEPAALTVGSPVRIIRAPWFGALGEVVELPVELTAMASETKVRVLVARLSSGETVTVPRANVEILED